MILFSLLVFIRIAAAIFTAPVFGHHKVPIFVRLGLSVLLSITIVPLLLELNQSEPPEDFVLACLNEVLIGGSIGLGISILLSAAEVAGQMIGQMAGINMVDPISTDNPTAGATGNFFQILSIATFVLMGGPELMVTATLDTFYSVPLGQSVLQNDFLQLIGALLGQSLSLSVRAIGPAIAALFISNLVIGFLNRAIPQLGMFQIGFNSNLIVFWISIFLTLGGCVWLFVDDIESAFRHLSDGTISFSAQPPNQGA